MGSEAESEQQAASPAVSSHTSRCIPRSCYGCNSKKIRCDKTEPCSSCARAGRPCVYPPVGPRKRRAKETIMADMASRISTLEKSVDKARNVETSVPSVPISETATTTRSTQPATTLHSDNSSERFREDILVQKGSSSQYFNEILLSRVIGEVSAPFSSKRLQLVILTDSVGAKHRICSDASSNGVFAPASIVSVQRLGYSLLCLSISSARQSSPVNTAGCEAVEHLRAKCRELCRVKSIASPHR